PGLSILDPDGGMASERSSVVDRGFGPAAEAALLSEYLSADRRFADSLHCGLEALRDDIMPQRLCIAQLPDTLRMGARHFHCRYLPIEAEAKTPSLLLVIDDGTERLRRPRAGARQREL